MNIFLTLFESVPNFGGYHVKPLKPDDLMRLLIWSVRQVFVDVSLESVVKALKTRQVWHRYLRRHRRQWLHRGL